MGAYPEMPGRIHSKEEDDVKRFRMPRSVSAVALHPSGDKFVVGSSSDLWVRIHDAHTGDEQGKKEMEEQSSWHFFLKPFSLRRGVQGTSWLYSCGGLQSRW